MGQCASIFYRREQFQGHLREKHGNGDENYIRDQCKRCHIGRNGQNAFWCGFCKQIVKLKTEGLEAWEERFSHIDDCHYKKGQTIYDWVPLDADVPKGLMERVELPECEQADDDNGHQDESEGASEDDGDCNSTRRSSSNGLSPKPNGAVVSDGASAGRHTGSKGQVASSKRGRIWHCVSLHETFPAIQQVSRLMDSHVAVQLSTIIS